MLSNIVDWLLLPSNLIVGLGILGILALVLRRRRLGLALTMASVILLAIAGWSPLGPWLLAALEDRFPKPAITAEPAGIIMLGGAVDTHISLARGAVTLNDGAERVVEIAALSRLYPEARILLSGGAGPHQAGAPTETALARDQLVALGVPSNRIELEERSLTTCENATESAEAVAPAPDDDWLLVTSAHHMPRAVACFRAAGFEVIAYPVDYRTEGRGTPSSVSVGLKSLDAAAHEWIGLITYRLFGSTDELFPAPTPNEAEVVDGG